MLENKKEMEVKVSINGQMVYVVHETPGYYLVSLYPDGSKRFKADKMKAEA